ncbi:hypothetical protein LT699_11045 [Pseudomonas syringae pv. syringae]|uniref:hypothetical protein n=1 Tax=Pseudomonas syringae TaxID=317 RepID=UPI00200A4CCD|nr:hypothetical protein [Pseudomonas syringae]MCK9747130.1 hypothetical protein [Pseudomonas syringae pv. syringae]
MSNGSILTEEKMRSPLFGSNGPKEKRYSLLIRLRRIGRRHLNLYRSCKGCPGEIKVSIALGGMVIGPGDLVIGDDDLPCVPFDQAEGVSILMYIRYILLNINYSRQDISGYFQSVAMHQHWSATLVFINEALSH